MKYELNFNVDYRTTFGEQLVLVIGDSMYNMGTVDGSRWTQTLFLDLDKKSSVDYFYVVYKNGLESRREWQTETHKLELNNDNTRVVTTYDKWIDIPENSFLYTSAITECLARREKKPLPNSKKSKVVRFKVRAPQLRDNETLAIVGDDKPLGEWKALKAVRMYEHCYNEWVIEFDVTKFTKPVIEFKFVALDEEDDVTPFWETGENRVITLPNLNDNEMIVYEMPEASFNVYPIRCAGTQIPVFSLRSKTSFGVGDFGDLRKFIDWMAKTKQKLLQILPINDTTITHTWTDSYPYSCISVFALHPQYVDLSSLPSIEDKEKAKEFEKLREELNVLPQIDYEKVNNAKIAYLRILFSQDGTDVLKSAAFKKFFESAKEWLLPYALYCYYREKFGTSDFHTWKGHEQFTDAEAKKMSDTKSEEYKEASFYYYVQFILDKQMSEIHEYARSKKVILKGDIPIGVNRNSCDVWVEPRYFNLNGQAGAPPDAFSVNGQNWGFPTYNWDEMLKDDCRWWVHRFTNMSRFFDAYRIDHVLGFFRIWEIPITAVHGLLGQFAPSLGMSREEVSAYGLPWQEDFFTKPFIADWIIDKIFGDKAGEVKEKYLNHLHDDIWEMKPEYDTQRKVEEAFAGKEQEELNVRDGLYALISNVLFVRDHRDENKFHPRISAQLDLLYPVLNDGEKAAFNRLYNDYYYRRNNQFWYREAMKKLPRLVNATRMLVCAEDLGMVPDCVSWVMKELRIITLEMQTMPKDDKVRFSHLSKFPYSSVCAFSSHDTPTLRQWWDEDYGRTQEYYNVMLHRGDEAPHPLPGWLASDIVSRQLTCPSIICVTTLQDWLAMDESLRLPDANAERINIPSNPKHYWRYRMHLNIEDLMAKDSFNDKIRQMVVDAGRG